MAKVIVCNLALSEKRVLALLYLQNNSLRPDIIAGRPVLAWDLRVANCWSTFCAEYKGILRNIFILFYFVLQSSECFITYSKYSNIEIRNQKLHIKKTIQTFLELGPHLINL